MSSNHAPVLTPSAPTLSTITEDDYGAAFLGQTVASLIGGRISDADAAALTGIAISGSSNSTNGYWQYSLDGSTWDNLGAVTETSARLLDASSRIRFFPDGRNGGTATLTYHAWDQTGGSGPAGSLADITAIGSGGDKAFSTSTDTASITITPVNDAPGLTTLSPITVAEGGSVVFSAANGNAIVVSDTDGGTGYETVTLQTNHGIITLGSTANLYSFINNASYVALIGTIANLNAALEGTTYTQVGSYHGSDYLRIEIGDNGNSGASLEFRFQAQVVPMTITPATPPPSPLATFAANEDTTLTVAAAGGLLASDTSGGVNRVVIDSAPAHAISFSLNADGSFNYTPTRNFSGVDTFAYHTFDGLTAGSSTLVQLVVAAVNDAPAIAPLSPITVAQGGSVAFSAANGNAIVVSDVDGGANIETVYLFVSHGIISLGATAGLQSVIDNSSAVILTGTISALNAALEGTTYTPTGTYNGLDQLRVQVDDNGNEGGPAFSPLSTSQVVQIAVGQSNVAPVNTVPGTLQALTNNNLTIAGLSVADPDAMSMTTTLHVDHGTLMVGAMGGASVAGSGTDTVTLTGTVAQINAALGAAGNVRYHSASGFLGADHLTMTSSDDGGTGAGVLSDIDTVTINVAKARPKVFDFDGDRTNDLFFLNDISHAAAVWQINDGKVVVGTAIGNVAPGWSFAGLGDFNGDRNTDLLLVNDTTHVVAEWQMSGSKVVKAASIGSINAAAGWRPQATGDFNGDGKTDLLFQNDITHGIAVWQLDGTAVTGAGLAGTVNTAGGWRLASGGDFNGDRKSDLLLLNDITNDVAVWQMDGTQIASAGLVGTLAGGWHFATTGDFDGDGKIDLLMLNDSSNGVAIWKMNGTQATSQSQVGTINVAAGWHFEDTGDFNGDRRTDLLFQNDLNHGIAIWQMAGADVTAGGLVDTINVAGGWRYQGPGDFNGDGRTDLLFQNDITHDVAEWLMNGTQIASSSVIGNVNAAAGWHMVF